MLALSTLVHIRSSILLYLCSDDDVDDGRSLVWELTKGTKRGTIEDESMGIPEGHSTSRHSPCGWPGR